MTEQPLIQVEGMWKSYGLPVPWRGLWRRLRGGAPPGEAMAPDGLPWALRGIELDVRAGETVGLIGRNGAGKSTLLKVLAGVSPPTHGEVTVRGALFPMIELNAGIHMDLTGYENIRLLAAVMGLSRRQVEARMVAIEAFCELGEWLRRPVRMYSSGMLVRLGFAVGIHVESDILLMDEVMAVGDLAFHSKCLRQLEEVRGQGRAILFVSHNMMRIRGLCDRVLLLEQGEPRFLGPAEEAIQRYEALSRGRGSQGPDGFDFLGVTLLVAEVRDRQGQGVAAVQQGEPVTFLFTLQCSQALERVNLNVAVESEAGVLVVWEPLEMATLATGAHSFRLHWSELHLNAGSYTLRITIGVGAFMQKGFRANHPLRVTGTIRDFGFYQPESLFERLNGG